MSGFDFSAAVHSPFRMQPGLRRLAPGATQLSPAKPGGRHQREKLAVLSAFSDHALAHAPGFDSSPALEHLAVCAAAEQPQQVRWDASSQSLSLEALALQVRTDGRLSPLGDNRFGLGDEALRCLGQLPSGWRFGAALALAFEDDFAVLDAGSGRIPWLAVALPSFWAPQEKVGLRFAEVHAPVADNQLLLKASDGLVRLVTQPEERWERFVWTLTGHPRLHAHPAHVAPKHGWPDAHQASDEAIAQAANWRTERQTFLPLPDANQAIFCIHVRVQPLSQALQSEEQAQTLHDALASMSDAVVAYRGLTSVRPALLRWLRSRSSSIAPSPAGA